MKYLYDFPKEFYKIQGMGFMQQLPVHKAIEKEEKPAYVYDVKYAMSAGMLLSTMVPKCAESGMFDGEYKYRMYHVTNPTDYTLEECTKAWNDYQDVWHKEGFDHPYIPYPYTREMMEGYFKEYGEWTGVPISADGPAATDVHYSADGLSSSAQTNLGKAPQWVNEPGALDGVAGAINNEHLAWWWRQASGSDLFQQVKTKEAQEAQAKEPLKLEEAK